MSLIVMGVNDHRHCIAGWHALQADGRNGVRFRWTSAAALFRIRLPKGASRLRFFLSGPAALTGRAASMSLCLGETRLAHLPEAAPTDFWTVAEVSLREAGVSLPAGSPIDLTIRSEELGNGRDFRPRTFTFDQYLGNGDHRPLGLMIGGIRLL